MHRRQSSGQKIAAPKAAQVARWRNNLTPKTYRNLFGYVDLANAQLTIDRVEARVRRGGHAIAAELIERRCEQSRINLIDLLPHLTELRVHDNSVDADPATGKSPKPKLLLHMKGGKILNLHDLKNTPDWAKPIVAALLKFHRERR